MNKIVILIFLLLSSVLAEDENLSAATFIKEKQEIKRIKQELNLFYNQKEDEYQKRKVELDKLLLKIEKEKKEIQAIYDKNLEALNDIEGAISGKTSKIYNAMKPKTAASIFNKMIDDGKIEDVFDIILKLKEKNVTLILKFLNVKHAAELTQMLENYNIDNELKDKTNG